MTSVQIIDTGIIDDRDCAFPGAVQLPNGELLCSYSVGNGPEVGGGTDFARSTDGGNSWTVEGTILPHDENNKIGNFLKLSLAKDSKTIIAYGSDISTDLEVQFGNRNSKPLFCTSTDNGKSWSRPNRVSMGVDCPLEVSCKMVVTSSGRFLAPAATLPDKEHLGEKVLVAISDDKGSTWQKPSTVFQDPEGKTAFFEQKITEIEPGKLLAIAWTASFGDYVDQENHFSLSNDDGSTWTSAISTGIKAQTMSAIPLGNDRLLLLYNRRYGNQGIVMALVNFSGDGPWEIVHEGMMYDTNSFNERSKDVTFGIDEFDDFAFGYPTAIPLQDGNIFATFWCKEEGKFVIRWTKLKVDWS
jgi:BNR repeat-like domain